MKIILLHVLTCNHENNRHDRDCYHHHILILCQFRCDRCHNQEDQKIFHFSNDYFDCKMDAQFGNSHHSHLQDLCFPHHTPTHHPLGYSHIPIGNSHHSHLQDLCLPRRTAPHDPSRCSHTISNYFQFRLDIKQSTNSGFSNFHMIL